MKTISTTLKEYVPPIVIILSFLAYYFDLLKDGMVISGVFAVIIMVYIAVLWQEKANDEREEYIRSKVDRYLYILTLALIFVDIVYKTFSHISYMNEVIILTVLSLTKVILSTVIRNQN